MNEIFWWPDSLDVKENSFESVLIQKKVKYANRLDRIILSADFHFQHERDAFFRFTEKTRRKLEEY